jgi:hypothetical protein
MPGDRRRTTGVYTHVNDEGKESRIVNLAADLKVVIGSVVALLGLVVMLAGWFNGHVQAQAIKALGQQLSTDGSDVQNAFEALLDKRAEEIEKNLREEIIRSRDLEADKLDDLRSMIWKATNPARLAGDPVPDWSNDGRPE